MRRACLVWGLMGWLLVATAAGADDTTTQPEGFVEATAVVRITYMSGTIAVTSDVIDTLLASSPVWRAALEGIPEPEEGWQRVLEVYVGDVGPPQTEAGLQNSLLKVGVRLTDWPGPRSAAAEMAQRLLAGFCRALKTALREVGSLDESRLGWVLSAAEYAADKARNRMQDLERTQLAILDEAGRAELDPDRIAEELSDLDRTLRDLDLRLVVKRARQTALTEQIARLGKEVGTQVDGDAAVAELAKIVQLREKALERGRELQRNNSLAQGEVDNLEEQLARARAELANQRQTVAQTAGGSLLPELNKELLTLTVDVAADEAEQSTLKQRLDDMCKRCLLKLANQYERDVQLELSATRAALEDAQRQQLQAQSNRTRYQAPIMLVLGLGQD